MSCNKYYLRYKLKEKGYTMTKTVDLTEVKKIKKKMYIMW